MGYIRKNSLKSNAGVLSLILAAAGGLASVPAFAQDQDTEQDEASLRLRTDYLGYAASISPRVGFSDNINLAPDGFKNSEILLSTLLSGSAIVTTKRVTALIAGDLDFSYFTDQSNLAVNQDLGAVATFTAADNLLYFDVSGATSRQLVGDNARFSSSINSARGQRANVHSFSASPYFLHKTGAKAEVELRYRFSQVFIDDQNATFNPGTNFLNDSRTHEVLARYGTGATFDRVKLDVSAYGNQTDETGSDFVPDYSFEQGTLLGEAEFAVNSKFSISGAVGYDEITTDSTDPTVATLIPDDLLSGFFWRAGFTARPGRRTRLKLEYGNRYDDNFIFADFSYDINSRFRFIAGADRSFQTRTQANAQQFRSLQTRTLDFAQRLRDGGEMSPRSIIDTANRFSSGGVDAQTIGISTTDSAFVGLQGAFDRLEVSATANFGDSDFGYRQIEVFGGGLNARYRFSRSLVGYGNVNFRHADTSISQVDCEAFPSFLGISPTVPLADIPFECAGVVARNGVSDTVSVTAGASYRLYSNVSIFGQVSHTNRFSPVGILEYDENSATAGLTLDF